MLIIIKDNPRNETINFSKDTLLSIILIQIIRFWTIYYYYLMNSSLAFTLYTEVWSESRLSSGLSKMYNDDLYVNEKEALFVYCFLFEGNLFILIWILTCMIFRNIKRKSNYFLVILSLFLSVCKEIHFIMIRYMSVQLRLSQFWFDFNQSFQDFYFHVWKDFKFYKEI